MDTPSAARPIDGPLDVVLVGGAGNDTLVGTAGADTLSGLGGNDLLEGGLGGDILDGGDGIDTVTYANATRSNVALPGFDGVMVYLSGGGSPAGEAVGDIYVSVENAIGSAFRDYISGNGQNNSLWGGDGADDLYGFGQVGSTTRLYGEAGMDTLIGGAGIDIMDGGLDEDTVTYLLSPTGLTISLRNQAENTGWAAGDTFISIQDVIGSEFNDVIIGNNDPLINQLQGQGGNDTIYGGGAAYTVLIGGVGADALHGTVGGLYLIDYETATSGVTASMENPSINTGDAAGDSYFELFGRDLAGSPFDDILYGDAGNNNLIADPDQTVYLNNGVDQLYGRDGNDTLDGGPRGDQLDGGNGFDAAAYATALGAVQAYLGTPGANQGDAAGDSYISIEAVIGSNFDDILGGNNFDNSLFGERGNDELRGEGGDDILVGGVGADVLIGGAGRDLAGYSESTVGLNINMLLPSVNTGNAFGDVYIDIEGIFGSNFNDVVVGNDVANTLLGNAGNDHLIGAGGDDILEGGLGADILDGSAGFNIASYASASAGVTASFDSAGSNTGEAAGDVYINIQQINGSNFGDILTGAIGGGTVVRGLGGNDALTALGAAQLNGDDGNDTLNGGNYDDTLIGGSGADQINGGLGLDLASYVTAASGVIVSLATGGSGGDATGDTFNAVENLAGSNFNDVLAGDAGANYLLGLVGDDTLDGGAGDDLLEGGAGTDTIRGGAGFDYVVYSQAASGVTVSLEGGAFTGDAAGDTLDSIEGIFGSAFGDTLTGNASENTVFAGGGNDTVFGGLGQDQLLGQDGNDVLVGGAGTDLLTGGAGADTFMFLAATDSQSTPNIVSDLIEDFQTGVDKIDISAFLPTAVSFTSVGAYTLVTAQSNSGVFAVRVSGTIVAGDIITTSTGPAITGTGGNDTLTGTVGADVIIGAGGMDYMTGGAGADTFRFLASSDSTPNASDIITDFQSGLDRLDLTAMNPTSVSMARFGGTTGTLVFAETPTGDFRLYLPNANLNGSDFLYNGTFGVYMIGSGEADTMVGTIRADPIQGGEGDDIITGGGGADAISGGAGADIFRYATASDSYNSNDGFNNIDNLYDFQTGVDRIDLNGINPVSISIIRTDNGSSFVFSESYTGAFVTSADRRAINGTDFIYNNTFGIYLVGSVNADTLIGSGIADSMQGNGGNDILIGGVGADAISSGVGFDIYQYNAVSDSTSTSLDNLYDFDPSFDLIDLSRLNPTAVSIVRTNEGSTYVFATTAAGNFATSAAGRLIQGNSFIGVNIGVFMDGSDLADLMTGSVLADTIKGGNGNDTVIGFLGADTLFGGAGADTFLYININDSQVGTFDQILDFQSGVDKINLSGLRTGASDVFGIVNTGGFSTLFVDLGGNGVNELQIQINNTNIVASDIIWSASGAAMEETVKVPAPEVLPVEGVDLGADDATVDGFVPHTGRFMLDLDPNVGVGFYHGQDWYL
ncbi:beta strand repeat-containing protein [Brevundimonas sp.]|uniref:beta strand repeat-containing protein n=1 Tax=Brevundimonas sp. TaxID=1871086 RepID=UPI00378417C3